MKFKFKESEFFKKLRRLIGRLQLHRFRALTDEMRSLNFIMVVEFRTLNLLVTLVLKSGFYWSVRLSW